MDKKEYNDKKKAINDQYRKDLGKLNKEFALSNNPYKVGDIIDDRFDIIKIEKIIIVFANLSSYPRCRYTGPLLTKKLIPYKSGEIGSIYQSAVKRKHDGSHPY